MKKLSIILSLIILLFCTTAFVACGGESVSGNKSATSVSESVGQEDENAEKPTYSGTNKLRIGMWSGIPTEVDGKKLTDEERILPRPCRERNHDRFERDIVQFQRIQSARSRRRRRGRYKTVDTGQRRDERFVRRKRRSGRQRAEKE